MPAGHLHTLLPLKVTKDACVTVTVVQTATHPFVCSLGWNPLSLAH